MSAANAPWRQMQIRNSKIIRVNNTFERSALADVGALMFESFENMLENVYENARLQKERSECHYNMIPK